MKFGKICAIVIVSMLMLGGLAVLSKGISQEKAITPSSQPAPAPTAFRKVNRVALWEDFTGWNCGPCAAYNPFLKTATETYTGGYLVNVAPAFIHVWWPGADNDPVHNCGDSVVHYYDHQRVGYYGTNFVPNTFFGGRDLPETQNSATLQGYFNAVRATLANMTVDTWGYLNTAANTGWIKVKVEVTSPFTSTDPRLFVNLWETNITRTLNGDAPPYPNGEPQMDWAVWRAFPGANGTALSIRNPGEVFEIQYNFTYDATWIDANMGATVFVQDIPTKNVEQAKVELFQKPAISLLNPAPYAKNQLYAGPISVNWNAIDTQTAAGSLTINLDYSTNNGTSWTNIATGIANTPPYSWTPTGIDTPYVKLRVTARDASGWTQNATSTEFFSVDMTANNRWYLQTQASFVAGKKDLDMKPMELAGFSFWDLSINPPQTTATVTAPSEVVVQSFASAYQAPSTMDVAGSWTFNIWGKANASTPMPAGNFYARVYATDGVTPRLLFTTAYDDENIGAFTTFHAFNWAFTAPSATMNTGERIQVDVVAHVTAAVANARVPWEIRSESSYNGTGTKVGTYTNLAAQDGSMEAITETLINPNTPLVFQDFTGAAFPPAGWAQSGTATSPAIWTRSATQTAGGAAPGEAKLTYVNENNAAGWRLYCGPFSTVGMASLTVTWKEYIDDYAAGYTLRVCSANAAAGPWTNSPWLYTGGSGSIGPRTSTATVTNNLNNANTYISWWLTGNCYNINYWFVDDVIIQQTASTSAMEQRYSISVPTGATTYVFSAYGNRPASADGDNFNLDYSTNGGTAWTTMATINNAANAWYNYTFPAAPGVPTFLLRVRDTIRTAGTTTLSTVNLDRMYVYTLAGNKITIGYDAYNQASYIDPTLNPGSGPAAQWQNITVVAGWNLVSVNLTGPTTMPGALTDKVGGVVWSRAMWYDPTSVNDNWKQYNTAWNVVLNDLTAVDNVKGVWIFVTTVGDGQICVGGAGYSKPVSTAVNLKTGWNMVGFPSDDTTYTVAMLKAACPTVTIVEQFNGAQTYLTSAMLDTDVFAPDKAYWVYTSADTVWNKAY